MNAAVGDGSLVRCFVPGRTKSKAIQCSLCTISSVWVLGSHSSYSTGGHEIAAMQCFFIFFSLIISPAECRQTTFNFFLRKKGQGRVRTRWRVCLKPTDLFTPANPKISRQTIQGGPHHGCRKIIQQMTQNIKPRSPVFHTMQDGYEHTAALS